MIDALLLMSAATMVSASKVCWGLYKGLVIHGNPWLSPDNLFKIVLDSEDYFIKRYPHHVAIDGWKEDHIEWIKDHVKDANWDWTPLGTGRYLFGFVNQEDAVLFKTTWH